MKYEKNHFGYSNALSDTVQDRLYNLNESISEILSSRPELKAIREIEFDITETPSINCTVKLRDGSVVERIFTSHVDEGAIELTSDEAVAYFGRDKYLEVEKFFEEDCGSLNAPFLKKHEPDLFFQLSELYLLGSTPNTLEGSEFTESDLAFFLGIIQESEVA